MAGRAAAQPAIADLGVQLDDVIRTQLRVLADADVQAHLSAWFPELCGSCD